MAKYTRRYVRHIFFNSKMSFVLHENVFCDSCKICPLINKRFHCVVCPDFDLCESCVDFTNNSHNQSHDMILMKQPRNTLIEHVIHNDVTCDGCKTTPIIGVRFKCTVCDDFDLCSKCVYNHDPNHHLIMMKSAIFGSKIKPIVHPPVKQIVFDGNQKVGAMHCNNWMAMNDFGFDMARVVFNKSSDSCKTFFISPFTNFTAFLMLANGAAEFSEARRELMNCLHLQQNLNIAGYNDQMTKIMYEMLAKSDSKVEILSPNAIFTRNTKADYRELLAQKFNALCKGLIGVDQINSWISEATRGKLNNTLSSLDPSTICVLISVLYFKANWMYQFDKSKTTPNSFCSLSGKKYNVPMMSLGKTSLQYSENNFFQFLVLPYGFGNFSAFILLPKDNNSLVATFKNLTANEFSKLVASEIMDVSVKLPRFKFNLSYDLIPLMKSLSVQKIFTISGDLSNLSDNPTGVDQAVHQTFCEVNEEGTEAAAVTVISCGFAMAAPKKNICVTCDHSFIFGIFHKPTGCILYVGLVDSPETL